MENKKTEEIMREVRKVIFGKDECIRQVMTAILAGGHILIEDIPGGSARPPWHLLLQGQ